jgi:ubiquinone/menaquinone biosynthesis C-methylase UbiE
MDDDAVVTKHKTNQYFSELATHYGANEKSNSDKYGVIKKLILPSRSFPDILECGGGAGFYTRRFLQDDYTVTCVDLSGEALAKNRKYAEKIGKADSLVTIEGDFVTVASSFDKQFDQVIFIKVFHHFDSLEEIYRALDAAKTLCKKNGRIVIFEPNGGNLLWKVFLSLQRDPVSGKSKWFYEQNMKITTVDNFKKYLTDIEYKIDYHYIIPSFILNKSFKGIFIFQRLNSILEKTPLRRFAFNVSVVIELL